MGVEPAARSLSSCRQSDAGHRCTTRPQLGRLQAREEFGLGMDWKMSVVDVMYSATGHRVIFRRHVSTAKPPWRCVFADANVATRFGLPEMTRFTRGRMHGENDSASRHCRPGQSVTNRNHDHGRADVEELLHEPRLMKLSLT